MYKLETIFLSRRNLMTLLSKLDRAKNGEPTLCTIKKYRGNTPQYQQSMDACYVVAVEDDVYYPSQNRVAGEVHPSDEPK